MSRPEWIRYPHGLNAETPLETAARWLAEAAHPICIAGRGIVRAHASGALAALCEQLPHLRVACTPGAKGVIPERHAQALGVWGFCGAPAVRSAVEQSDVLFIVGTRLLEQATDDWNARLRHGRVIRLDIDGSVFLDPNPEEVRLIGDAGQLLQALLQHMTPLERLHAVATAPVELERKLAPIIPEAPPNLVHPVGLLNILNRVATEIPICADAGNAMCWAIELLTRARPNDFYVSVDWGTMGFALPAAIGVALARRSAVIALTGDGSMAMAGGDLHTAVEHALPVIVVVLNDCGAGMVDAGCRAWFGNDRVPNQRYQTRIDFAQYGRSLGATSEAITSPRRLAEALREALSRPTPSVLDVHIDPEPAPAAIRSRVAGLGSSAARSRTGGGMC